MIIGISFIHLKLSGMRGINVGFLMFRRVRPTGRTDIPIWQSLHLIVVLASNFLASYSDRRCATFVPSRRMKLEMSSFFFLFSDGEVYFIQPAIT